MTRQETEAKIMEHLLEIEKIYHAYNPSGAFLTMSILHNHINMNNEYWDVDRDRIINHHVALGFENEGGEEE